MARNSVIRKRDRVMKKKSAKRKVLNQKYVKEALCDVGVRLSEVGGASTYNDAVHPEVAYRLSREHGFTYMQMARAFGVTDRTIQRWLLKFPIFKEKMQSGRDEFDTNHVEQMLLKRALGFEFQEKTRKMIRLNGKNASGDVIKVPATETIVHTKFQVPDVKAITFWLTNRNKERWQMISKIKAEIDSNQRITHVKADTADLAKMSVEQLKQLRGLIADTASADGQSVPIECQGDNTKMIEEFLGKAQEITDAEYIE